MTRAKKELPTVPADEFLDCRDLRHAWQWSNDSKVDRKSHGTFVFTRNLICARCGTLRVDRYIVTQTHVTRQITRYKYPDGYRVKGGFTAEAARVAIFHRFGRVVNGRVAG